MLATLIAGAATAVPNHRSQAVTTHAALTAAARWDQNSAEDRVQRDAQHRASRSTTRQPPVAHPVRHPTPRRVAPAGRRGKPHTVPVGAMPAVHATGAAGLVVAFALAQVGKPYAFGASGPDAYDCSGLAMAAYARGGIRLPHSSGGDVGVGRAIQGGYLPADLLIYPGHVAIYIGGGRMVEAPHTGLNVRIVSVRGHPMARRLI